MKKHYRKLKVIFTRKHKQKSKILKTVIIALSLITLITSCTTTKVEIKREVPILDFPQFPQIEAEFLEDTNEVKINLDTYINLAKFKIEYKGLIEYYETIKEQTK